MRYGVGGQRAVHCGTRAGHSEDEMAEGGEPLAVLAGLLRASAEDKARLEKRVDEEVERRREAVRGAQERADRAEGNAERLQARNEEMMRELLSRSRRHEQFRFALPAL